MRRTRRMSIEMLMLIGFSMLTIGSTLCLPWLREVRELQAYSGSFFTPEDRETVRWWVGLDWDYSYFSGMWIVGLEALGTSLFIGAANLRHSPCLARVGGVLGVGCLAIATILIVADAQEQRPYVLGFRRPSEPALARGMDFGIVLAAVGSGGAIATCAVLLVRQSAHAERAPVAEK